MSEATAEAPEPKLVYEIEVDLPDLPKGELVQIPGLGTYENKGKYDVNADEAQAYRVYHTHQEMLYEDEDDPSAITGSVASIGPTLLEASKSMYGVTVTTYAKQPNGGNN